MTKLACMEYFNMVGFVGEFLEHFVQLSQNPSIAGSLGINGATALYQKIVTSGLADRGTIFLHICKSRNKEKKPYKVREMS